VQRGARNSARWDRCATAALDKAMVGGALPTVSGPTLEKASSGWAARWRHPRRSDVCDNGEMSLSFFRETLKC
jgi:hypothetical protein